MAEALKNSIAFVGIDIGKNSFHVVGLDERGAIVLRQDHSGIGLPSAPSALSGGAISNA